MKGNIILIILSIISCTNTCDWKGGEILNFGEYCNADVKIHVYEKNNFLKYEVHNNKGEIIIRDDVSISTFQHWALFLDSNKNFWVMSSDIGGFVWERDPVNNRYSKKIFYHELGKDDVPLEIYESSLKRFLKKEQ